MKIISMAEAKNNLAHYIKVCQTELVVITKNGSPYCMLRAVRPEDVVAAGMEPDLESAARRLEAVRQKGLLKE